MLNLFRGFFVYCHYYHITTVCNKTIFCCHQQMSITVSTVLRCYCHIVTKITSLYFCSNKMILHFLTFCHADLIWIFNTSESLSVASDFLGFVRVT